MKHVLTIDRGNSSTKLTLWDAGAEPQLAVPLDFARVHGFPAIADMLRFLKQRPIVGAALSAVAPVDDDVLNALGVPVATVADVNFATLYHPKGTLGADRVAAMLGAVAFGVGKRILVADLGTAATFDFIDVAGVHIGGNIAPGLGMRLRALHSMTARLPLLEKSEPSVDKPGQSTAQAIARGCADGLLAELNHYASLADQVFITGRDAPLLAPLAGFNAIVDPYLVGRGLLSILHSK